MTDMHVVFGVGNAVVRELVRQGKRVRGMSRSGQAIVPSGVEMIAGDTKQIEDVRRAMEGAAVAYQCLFPAVQDAIIEVAGETGTKLVVANNLYMYDPKHGPMSETSAHAYGNREGGRFYAEMGEQALAAHRSGKIRATVGQASDIYGPNVRHGIGRDQLFAPVRAGKPANFIGDLDVVHTYTYADDCARALVTLAERDEALGETWHIPSAEPITTRRLFEMIFEELDAEPKIRVANGLLLGALSLFSGQMRTLKREKAYQFVTPWLVDHTKYERAFGVDVTPHRQAVADTVAWFEKHPSF